MNNHNNNILRFIFVFLDLGIINIVYIFLMLNLDRVATANNEAYVTYILFCNIAWLACTLGTQLYFNSRPFNLFHFGKHTIKTFIIYCVVILAFLFIYHFSYSRLFIGLSLGGVALVLLFSRFLVFFGRNLLRGKEGFNKKVVVIGYNRVSKKLVQYFSLTDERVCMDGYFENFENITELSIHPIKGGIDDTIRYAVENDVDEIYSTISPEQNPAIYELAATANKNLIHFRFVPDLDRKSVV